MKFLNIDVNILLFQMYSTKIFCKQQNSIAFGVYGKFNYFLLTHKTN